MSKEKKIQLAAAECLEVAKDLMFCVVAGNLELSAHRLGSCVSTLEKLQLRLMSDILDQQDVMTPPEARQQIHALREQIATMEGGLAKVIQRQGDWEKKYWSFREKVKQALLRDTWPEGAVNAIIGPEREEGS